MARYARAHARSRYGRGAPAGGGKKNKPSQSPAIASHRLLSAPVGKKKGLIIITKNPAKAR